jgi:hypothetical protein|tara:strand:- start:453 stop:629 length:177 start_codon:yes stop_codon:yes gene_type:complete
LSYLILLLSIGTSDVQGLDDPRLQKPIIIIFEEMDFFKEEPLYYLAPPYRDEKFQNYA